MTAPMQLRGYQEKTVTDVCAGMARGQSTLVIAPCGAGKTEMAVGIIRRAGGLWLWVVTLDVLAEQALARLRERGISARLYRDEGADSASSGVIVATVQGLLSTGRLAGIAPSGVVLDEAHHYEADEWASVRDRFSGSAIVGLTATPERDDGIPVAPHYHRVVQAGTYRELLAHGHLVSARLYAPPVVSPAGLAMHPVDSYLALSGGARTVASFGRVREAEFRAAEFRAAGIKAECIHGKQADSWRNDKLDAFRAGELQVLTSVYVLAEGFDVPDVGCVILGRRFQFLGTYMQFTGRALRPAAGKRDAVVVDLTGASWSHGPPDEDKAWDLLGKRAERERAARARGSGDAEDRTAPDVSGEGLVRVKHGALSPSDPDPAPLEAPNPSYWGRRVQSSIAVGRAERRLAARKGADVARKWGERERKRSMPFSLEVQR